MNNYTRNKSTTFMAIIGLVVLLMAWLDYHYVSIALLIMGAIANSYVFALQQSSKPTISYRPIAYFIVLVSAMPFVNFLYKFLDRTSDTHLFLLLSYLIMDTLVGIMSYRMIRDNLLTWERTKARLDLITLSLATTILLAVYTIRFIRPSFSYDLEIVLLIICLANIGIGIVTSSTVFNALFNLNSRRRCYYKSLAYTLYFYSALLRTGEIFIHDYFASLMLYAFSIGAIITSVFTAVLATRGELCRQERADQPENFSSGILLYLVFAIVLAFYAKGIIYIQGIILAAIIIIAYQALRMYLQRDYLSTANLHIEKQTNQRLITMIQASESELRRMNQQLIEESRTDSLTSLGNRRFLYEYLSERMVDSPLPFTMLLINLDRFKLINDLYGHSIGDDALVTISKRIAMTIQQRDLVFRLGGDEFVVLIERQYSDDIYQCAVELLNVIEQPIEMVNYRFQCQASIGIASYPVDAMTINAIMKAADLAVREAKHFINREKINTYARHLGERDQRHNQIEFMLKQTEDFSREFSIYLQPIINAKDGDMIAAEALLRWHNDALGTISPGEFIPIAEACHIIYPLTLWVIEQVIHHLTSWQSMGLTVPTIGINISPKVLSANEFVPRVERMITQSPQIASAIDLEITEHTAMASSTYMEEVLTHLKALGFSISIDDFGTGYSSLNYIKNYNIDYLKIDKLLIDHIVNDLSSRQIIKAIIAMAEAMDMTTIAEGVELADQYHLLRQMNCQRIQGYYFAKPMPIDTFYKDYLNVI